MINSEELSPLNAFLVEKIAIDGVQTEQTEDGDLNVVVPAIEQDASLFVLDRADAKRFYGLASQAGRLGLNVSIDRIGPVNFQFFHVTELSLPEDAAEFRFLANLGDFLINQMLTPDANH